MDEQDKREEHRLLGERVVRWDRYRIDYFTFTNNIFIGLNLGFVGFFISQSGLIFRVSAFTAMLQGLTFLLLLSSFFTGTCIVILRLMNFRLTSTLTKYRKASFEVRHRIKNNIDSSNLPSKIYRLKKITDYLGKITWKLLFCQIWTFILGSFLGIIFLTIISN